MRSKLAAVLGVTAACLLWVLWGIDLADVRVSLTGVRWELVGLSILVYTGVHFVRSLRFQLLVGPAVGFWRMTSICAVGFLAINVVPLRLGEFVRPYLLAERGSTTMGNALGAVVLERMIDMSMLLGLLLFVAFGLDLPAGEITVEGVDIIRAGQHLAGTTLVGGILFLAILTWRGESFAQLIGGWFHWVPVIGPRLPSFLATFARAPRKLAARPAAAIASLALSLLVWGGTISCVQLVLLAFEGLPTGMGVATVVWTITITGMTVLPTPGFFGAFEAFCLAALMVWDVDPDVGTTYAVILHLTQFVFSVASGGLCLFLEGLSLGRIVEKSQMVASGTEPGDA